MVDARGRLVATFNKNRWVTYTPSEKPGGTHNKAKSLVGTLSIFPAAERTNTLDIKRYNSAGIQSRVDNLDHRLSGSKGKGTENVNLEGVHVGNLTEEVIVLTAWMQVEAEHRLRYKILDVLQEIGENAGG